LGAPDLAGELCGPLRRFADRLVGSWENGLAGCRTGEIAPEFLRMEGGDGGASRPGTGPGSGIRDGNGGGGGEKLGPLLRLENRVFCSDAFERCHVEVAVSGQGLQVVHFTMMPRNGAGSRKRDGHVGGGVPPVVLAGDVVGYRGVISFAILDPTPMGTSRCLPPAYDAAVARLQDIHFGKGCAHVRDGCAESLPEWGRRIFGARCVCLRRQDFVKEGRDAEFEALVHNFLAYAEDLVDMHCSWCENGDEQGASFVMDAGALHAYNAAQRENEMTVQVLEKCFGRDVAVRYMSDVMFPDSSG